MGIRQPIEGSRFTLSLDRLRLTITSAELVDGGDWLCVLTGDSARGLLIHNESISVTIVGQYQFGGGDYTSQCDTNLHYSLQRTCLLFIMHKLYNLNTVALSSPKSYFFHFMFANSFSRPSKRCPCHRCWCHLGCNPVVTS